MKTKKIMAGILAMTLVCAVATPVIQSGIEPLTAYAWQEKVESNWDIKKYYDIGDFTIQYVQSGYVQIISYNNPDAEEVVIPETFNDGDNDFPVQVLYGESFQNCQMKKITIPDTVKKIGTYAFCNCDKLEEIVGMKNVEEICDNAFTSCQALKEIHLPDTLRITGTEAFAFCNSLTEVTIPGSLTSMGTYMFTTCMNLETITIEEGVKTISDKMTYNCRNLKTVNIPASVTTIRDGAFQLTGLEEFVVPDTVTKLGIGTFSNCSLLKSVTLSKGCTVLESELFLECHALETVQIPDGVTRIRQSAFSNCGNVKTLTLPESVSRIESYAFYNCSSLETINLPEGITRIDEYTFCKCSALNPVTLPSTLTQIGVYAFYDCASLDSIVIPATVTKVDSYAFYGCNSMKTAKFEGSMDSLGIWCFAGCTALEEIQLPKDLTVLDNHVLYRCESLQSVEIPETVTKIEKYALAACSSLTEVQIPASVTKVEDFAIGYGEGVLPEVNKEVNIVSESPAVQDFCKDNKVVLNGEVPKDNLDDPGNPELPVMEELTPDSLIAYLHGHVTMTEEQFQTADQNGDGIVNIFDWVLLNRSVAMPPDTEEPSEAPEIEPINTEAPEEG